MSSHPCDEFSADALIVIKELEAETGVRVRLNIHRITDMVEALERLLSDGTISDCDEMAEVVLGRASLDDIEYTAYKRWLDRIFKRRKAAA